MSKVIIIFLISWFTLFTITAITTRINSKVRSNVTESLEYSYFEGQYDAVNGDIRIAYDSVKQEYIWISSPWNDGELDDVIYNPKGYKQITTEINKDDDNY